ncbi:MAG: NAD(P)H-dependent glycerol-3-phosphate dehydrogenase [Minwuia sp.]|uniref:NAD(P)H-dependent glycerol-3-phosphate dehydrogenase n=1 Tax=Minwuia sp. TaxID=2493630 RepID=UPI003A88BC53
MSHDPEFRIVVAGAGAWGAALATQIALGGRRVALWGRDAGAIDRMAGSRRHPSLPGSVFPDGVSPVSDPAVLQKAGTVVLAVPAQTLRSVLSDHGLAGANGQVLIVAAKGLEQGTGLLMTEVAGDACPYADIAMLSGPTFAVELAAGLPAAAVMAARDPGLAEDCAALFRGRAFRVYASPDLIGVALGGAAKNVLAIAAGAVMGAELGANARAAVISRGVAELSRLGAALGASPSTMAGLSGLGDIVLSCTDPKSRNYSLGLALGRGEPPPSALAEGAHTVAPLLQRAAAAGVDMPIAAAVDAVLNRGRPLTAAVSELMLRPEGAEAPPS